MEETLEQKRATRLFHTRKINSTVVVGVSIFSLPKESDSRCLDGNTENKERVCAMIKKIIQFPIDSPHKRFIISYRKRDMALISPISLIAFAVHHNA
jgi:hypothetical protein